MKKNSFSDISKKRFLPNMIRAFIFGKMHLLQISENEFFHDTKLDKILSFMDFMMPSL